MFIATWLWIAAGAGLGALLRWRLSVWLNPASLTFPTMHVQRRYNRGRACLPGGLRMPSVGVSP